jgi:deazaflavin-dependent oxidoreductase (nitroreductase family)
MSTIRKQRLVTLFYSIVNPIVHLLVVQFGLGTGGDQDFLRILRVRGRKSGRIYEMPVRIAVMDGERYLMSMLGETQWVRNLRAAGAAQLLSDETIEQVRVDELNGEEKATFFSWYCKHPQYMQRARYGLKVDIEHLTPVELEGLARLYPVFRLGT